MARSVILASFFIAGVYAARIAKKRAAKASQAVVHATDFVPGLHRLRSVSMPGGTAVIHWNASVGVRDTPQMSVNEEVGRRAFPPWMSMQDPEHRLPNDWWTLSVQDPEYRASLPFKVDIPDHVWDNDDQQFKTHVSDKDDPPGKWLNASGKFTTSPSGNWIPASFHQHNLGIGSPPAASLIKDYVWDRDDQQYKIHVWDRDDPPGKWRNADGNFTTAPSANWIPASFRQQNLGARSTPPAPLIKDSTSVEAEDDQIQWSQMNGKVMEYLKDRSAGNPWTLPWTESKLAEAEASWLATRAHETEFGYTSQRLEAARDLARLPISGKPEGLVGPQRPEDIGKLTVVLDLDGCLVSSRRGSDEDLEAFQQDESLDTKTSGEFVFKSSNGHVRRSLSRPGLQQFLAAASKEFELMVYTAGSEGYARPILDHLDPTGSIFRHRLYRDSTSSQIRYITKKLPGVPKKNSGSAVDIKDLARFNRPMNRIVLVDDNPMSFLPQLQNGVPINSFYDDQSDTALTVLSSFLDHIKNEPDVRPSLTKSFNLEKLLHQDRKDVLG